MVGVGLMKKLIFGKCYSFSGEPDHQVWLAESLGLYADAGDLESQVDISISRYASPGTPLAINPRFHREYEDGMLTSFPPVDVSWRRNGNGCLKVDVVLKPRDSIKQRVKKLISIEYATDVEYFEQLLHEFVLVPSTYFFDDLAPVHASCMTVDGAACLLAGTGGAGKSAAILALRRDERVGFVCDDIAIMSATSPSHSVVYANMAWPKIYGYDCAGNELEGVLLGGRGWVDRSHFRTKNWINPAGVRRKIRPDHLYREIEPVAAPASRLYYVIRESVSEMKLATLDTSSAVEMTIAVISAEYSIFHDHLHWEKYNALATGRKAMLSMDEVLVNWRNVLAMCLTSVACFKLSVPIHMDHAEYRARMVEILMGEMRAAS